MLGIVVIGRNESLRLAKCLRSVPATFECKVVYVDSRSADSSCEIAHEHGVEVVRLDTFEKTSAALGRNEGFLHLSGLSPPPAFVQFIDADCVLDSTWLEHATKFLVRNPKAGAVCGVLQEADPEASIFNLMAKFEWDNRTGPIATCGGIAMVRREAFLSAGGFDPFLSAGEEADFYERMRFAGWEVHRIDASMATHDSGLMNFVSWWRRSKRGGMAVRLGIAYYQRDAKQRAEREGLRIIFWAIPAGLILVGPICSLCAIFGLSLYAALFLKKYFLRKGKRYQGNKEAFVFALLTVVEKLPRFIGFMRALLRLRKSQGGSLIEYK